MYELNRLLVESCRRGPDKDLTTEGIEPNPGPVDIDPSDQQMKDAVLRAIRKGRRLSINEKKREALEEKVEQWTTLLDSSLMNTIRKSSSITRYTCCNACASMFEKRAFVINDIPKEEFEDKVLALLEDIQYQMDNLGSFHENCFSIVSQETVVSSVLDHISVLAKDYAIRDRCVDRLAKARRDHLRQKKQDLVIERVDFRPRNAGTIYLRYKKVKSKGKIKQIRQQGRDRKIQEMNLEFGNFSIPFGFDLKTRELIQMIFMRVSEGLKVTVKVDFVTSFVDSIKALIEWIKGAAIHVRDFIYFLLEVGLNFLPDSLKNFCSMLAGMLNINSGPQLEAGALDMVFVCLYKKYLSSYVDKGDFLFYLKSLSFSGNDFGEGLREFFSPLVHFLSMTLNLVMEKLGVKQEYMIQPEYLLGEKEKMFMDRLKILETLHKEKKIQGAEFMIAVFALDEDIRVFLRDKEIRPSVKYKLDYISSRLKPILAQCNDLCSAKTGARVEPIGVLVGGPTNVGKSTVTLPNIMAILSAIIDKDVLPSLSSKNVNDLIFQRNPENEFWDGIKASNVAILLDDAFQMLGTPGSPEKDAFEVIRLINNAAYHLHMAAISDKANHFANPLLVYATTNRKKLDFKGVYSSEAVARRFKISVIQVPKIKYSTIVAADPDCPFSRRIDFDKVRADFPIIEGDESSHYPWDIFEYIEWDFSAGRRANGGRIWSRDEMIMNAIKAYQENKAKNEILHSMISREVDRWLRVRDVPESAVTFHDELRPQEEDYKDPAQFHYQPSFSLEGLFSTIGKAYSGAVAAKRILTNVIIGSDNDPNPSGLVNTTSKVCSRALHVAAEVLNVPTTRPITFLEPIVLASGESVPIPRSSTDLELTADVLSAVGTKTATLICNLGDRIAAILYDTVIHIGDYTGWNELPQDFRALCKFFFTIYSLTALFIYFTHKPKPKKKGRSMATTEYGSEAHVSSSGEHEKIGKKKRGLISGRAKGRIRVGNMMNPEVGLSQGSQYLNAILASNVYSIRPKGSNCIGFVTFVKGTTFMCPHHFHDAIATYYEDAADGDPWIVELVAIGADNVSCAFDWEEASKWIIPHTPVQDDDGEYTHVDDIIFVRLDRKQIRSHANRSRAFPKAELIKDGSQYPGMMAVLRGKLVTVLTLHATMGDNSFVAISMGDGQSKYFYSRKMNYSAPTMFGDCGAPIVCMDPRLKEATILGYHVMGSDVASNNQDKRKFCSGYLVTQEIVERALEELGEKSEFDEIKIPFELNPECTMRGFHALGKGPMRTSASKSKIRPSVFHGHLFPAEKAPARLAPFYKDGVLVDPLDLAQRKYLHDELYLDPILLDESAHEMEKLILAQQSPQPWKPRVFTLKEAIDGIPGYVEAISRKTAVSLIFEDQKKDKRYYLGEAGRFPDDDEIGLSGQEEFRKMMDNITGNAKRGVRGFHPYVDCLKDELRPLAKVEEGKTRQFMACPLDYLTLFRRYFGDFIRFIISNRIVNGIAVGIDPFSEWASLYDYLHSIPMQGAIAGDFQSFDGKILIILLMRCLEIIEKYYYNSTEEDRRVRYVLFMDIINSRHLVQGIFYEFFGSQASGNPITAILNSMVNLLMLGCVIILKCSRVGVEHDLSLFRFSVYGDDNVVVPPVIYPFIDQKCITDGMMELFRIVYTSEDKESVQEGLRAIEEVSFLKRGFRHSENGVVAPLALASLTESLLWYHDGAPPETLAERVEDILFEFALHGRTIFDEYGGRLVRACRELGVSSPRGDTYERALRRGANLSYRH